MKKLWWVILLLLVVGGYMWWVGAPPFNQTAPDTMKKEEAVMEKKEGGEAMAKNAVTIQGFAFSPPTLTIKVGESVTWTNKDLVGHSATADDKSFDIGVIGQGESATATFIKAGTFTYHCTPHPNMKGTIIVE